VLDTGTLQVVDNEIDQATGTVRMKAEFPNQGLRLWPGQLVNVRLLVETLKQAVVVPTSAVQRGPNGTFVYVLNDEQSVSMRPVTVTQQDDVSAVILSGLEQGKRVVTTGFAKLADGTQVAVQPASDSVSSSDSSPLTKIEHDEISPAGTDAAHRGRHRHPESAGGGSP
jgi:multidrug efflux system membrane fusion protein